MSNSDAKKKVVVYNFGFSDEKPNVWSRKEEEKGSASHIAIIVYGKDGSRRIGVAKAETAKGGKVIQFGDYNDHPFSNKILSNGTNTTNAKVENNAYKTLLKILKKANFL